MNDESGLAALHGRIKFLNLLYLALFGASLAMIVLQGAKFGFTPFSTLAWAGTLGGAVCVRLYRRSLLNKYNEAKGGPLA